jgi:multimeric flavodoxin WrbA
MNALILNCSPVRDGATAEIVRIIAEQTAEHFLTKTACIDDSAFRFCTGCRRCHETAQCVLPDDGVNRLMDEFAAADVIVCVSPSYWADIPGQFKAFIDRCTPWCNTHTPHRSIPAGKKGYAVALRTGPGRRECERIIESITHFYGHLEIECCGSLCLTGIEYRSAVAGRMPEILEFCAKINGSDIL